MNVTSMLSAGYLEPAQPISAAAAAKRAEEDARSKESLAVQEDDILSQERALKAKAGSAAEVHTTYTYTVGEDGQRYITGASVTVKGGAEDAAAAGGSPQPAERGTKEIRSDRNATAADESGDADKSSDKARSDGSSSGSKGELSEGEKQEVSELRRIDREVRAHEAAHMAAAGGLGGGASYSYTKGPDGVNYATAGEVPIQMREGSTPEETLRNMQQVQRAALAPADPSGQDRSVAAAAAAKAARARSEIASSKSEELKTSALKGTPVRDGEQKSEDPSKKGASSVVASVRENEIQNPPAKGWEQFESAVFGVQENPFGVPQNSRSDRAAD